MFNYIVLFWGLISLFQVECVKPGFWKPIPAPAPGAGPAATEGTTTASTTSAPPDNCPKLLCCTHSCNYDGLAGTCAKGAGTRPPTCGTTHVAKVCRTTADTLPQLAIACTDAVAGYDCSPTSCGATPCLGSGDALCPPRITD